MTGDKMELIVFDLDGTLLNARSEVSGHTRETLQLLHRRGIAYTVATGRTLHAARDLLHGHGFTLPHIYKNGVVIWRPESDGYSHSNLLTNEEIHCVLDAFLGVGVAPFIFTLEEQNHHAVYHPPLHTAAEHRLAALLALERGLQVLPIAELGAAAKITNVSALGSQQAIESVRQRLRSEPHLVAYAGMALEGDGLIWVDIHHSAASKGTAVAQLKQDLGVSRVICFGDSDNDLSMFAMADECYAPSNARAEVRAAATAVIGHHDEDGISRFLRKRFAL
jgi:Cof subfamily protein (haloacid dehalogenase superfamily)